VLRRSKIDATHDGALMASGRALRDSLHRCEGRQFLIAVGVIGLHPNLPSLKFQSPRRLLSFQSVPEDMHLIEGHAG
jgi:hypothetical protein